MPCVHHALIKITESGLLVKICILFVPFERVGVGLRQGIRQNFKSTITMQDARLCPRRYDGREDAFGSIPITDSEKVGRGTGSGVCLDTSFISSGLLKIPQIDEEIIKKEYHLPMKLKLPVGDFRAYLFDCDGTIVDSMPLHYVAWKEALAEWDCVFEETLFYSWGGRPVTDIIASLNEMQGLKMPVEALSVRKELLYHAQIPTLKAIPEVVEHIDDQHGRIPFAVVSGSRRNSVVGSLTALNLLDKFDTLVCAEDYKNGKPAPDAFLLAAERLGIAPEYCLVFEDTAMGIQAATAAGMASVLVPSPTQRN